MTDKEKTELLGLLKLPAFLRFLSRNTQCVYALGTSGTGDRDLNFHEGRRSLALDMLGQAEEALGSGAPIPMLVSIQMFLDASQSASSEKLNARRSDTYNDLGSD